MTDKFAHLEEPKSNARMIVAIAFGLIFVILAYRVFTAASRPIEGVVESIDLMRVTNAQGEAVEDVSVRLPDGSIVRAEAANSETLHARDQVRVMEQRTRGAEVTYLVIAKNRSSGP